MINRNILPSEPLAKLMSGDWLPHFGPFPSWNFAPWNHHAAHSTPKMDSKWHRHSSTQSLASGSSLLMCLLSFTLAVPAWGESEALSWNSLSEQEQHTLKGFHDRWGQLTSERQHRLRKGADRWLKMAPEQRKKVRGKFQKWKRLPPEKRRAIRERYRKFRQLPPEQRRQLLRQRHRFRGLSPERQRELRHRWRNMTPEQRHQTRRRFRNRHSERHQHLRQGRRQGYGGAGQRRHRVIRRNRPRRMR